MSVAPLPDLHTLDAAALRDMRSQRFRMDLDLLLWLD